MSETKENKDEIKDTEEEKRELIRNLDIEQRDNFKLPGNLMERNLGAMEAMPNVLSFFGGPTVIAITFAALILSQKFWVTLIFLALLFLFIFLIFGGGCLAVAEKYNLLGGHKFITRPIKKNLFQFLKLLIFLFIVSFVPTVLSNAEFDIDRIKGITGLFLLIYFVDLIATKIIRYAKDEIFYDLSIDKGKKKLMNYLELLVCLLSIIAYGLVIFQLAPKDYNYQIAIYFAILLLLATIFTIVDNLLLIRERKEEEIENIEAIEDIEGVYYDEIERWRFISYFMFGGALLIPFSIAMMIVIVYEG